MNYHDEEYRKKHGVVPQLDFVNNRECLSEIPKKPIVYSKFAYGKKSIKNVKKGKVAKGLGNAFLGVFSMGTGNFGYGMANLTSGLVDATTGAIASDALLVDHEVTQTIREAEEKAWDRYQFLANFSPAVGNLGDTYFKDGSCDEFHCGNGFRIFENGDYFEGSFEDGEFVRGVYIWANGSRFLGTFQNQLKNEGISLFPDGTRCDGTYMDNMLHGVGTNWYTDGVYWGEWLHGLRHGLGYCRYADNTSFAGYWVDDQPQL
ncbi:MULTISPECIES: hypothetical protein [Eubacterium]|uniref:Uncharacterized conserved protein n=1 Tax=Eubacterium barkeri TaxID=1528 RepID=A0A1H3CBW0_EUBBA|nr:hypothetical protein [Eubacterium barkeri]SDX51565.1 Uncharacterized conserved protein [Eubacterium barkeri]